MSIAPAAKQRRNRAKKPAWTYAGLNVEQWQADSSRVRWAQSDAMFKDVLTVMTNARLQALVIVPGTSENRQLGKVEGFEMAIATLLSLARGTLPPPGGLGDPDYPSPDTDDQ